MSAERQSRRFTRASVIALCVTVALLLFLFLYPRKYMLNMTTPIIVAAREAEQAVLAADWPGVEMQMETIRAHFHEGCDVAKLFLNHEDLDEMEALIGAASRTAEVQDDAELLIHLERIIGTAEYLAGIETFDIVDLF